MKSCAIETAMLRGKCMLVIYTKVFIRRKKTKLEITVLYHDVTQYHTNFCKKKKIWNKNN